MNAKIKDRIKFFVDILSIGMLVLAFSLAFGLLINSTLVNSPWKGSTSIIKINSTQKDSPDSYITTELTFKHKDQLMSFYWKDYDILPYYSGNTEYYAFVDDKGTSWLIPFDQCIKRKYWVHPNKE